MGEDDPPCSLEYIEDPYFTQLETNVNPSFDEVTEYDQYYDNEIDVGEWSAETELYLRSLTLDQILAVPDDLELTHDLQTVETEFSPLTTEEQKPLRKFFRLKLFSKKALREVKVTFIDLSKPYLAKISSNDNYKKFLNMSSTGNTNYSFCSTIFIHMFLSNREVIISVKTMHTIYFFTFNLYTYKY